SEVTMKRSTVQIERPTDSGSALYPHYLVPAHNRPVLDFGAWRKRSPDFALRRSGRFKDHECLQVHNLHRRLRRRDYLSRPLVNHRYFHPRIDPGDDAFLRAREYRDCNEPDLCSSMLSRFEVLAVHDPARFIINNYVTSFFYAP